MKYKTETQLDLADMDRAHDWERNTTVAEGGSRARFVVAYAQAPNGKSPFVTTNAIIDGFVKVLEGLDHNPNEAMAACFSIIDLVAWNTPSYSADSSAASVVSKL